MRQIYITWLCIAVLSCSVLGAMDAKEVAHENFFIIDNSSYTSFEPIRIDNDIDFINKATEWNWPGNGTAENPFIIEGYDINGCGSGYCIYVGNTTHNFMVKDCFLHNASGLMLYNVQNSNIINNTVINNEYGLNLDRSHNNMILHNNISNNYLGICMFLSETNIKNCKIDGNTFGIYNIGDANNFEINTFADGQGEEVVTLINGGSNRESCIRLPERAMLKSANMTVTGRDIRNEAVIEDSYWQMYPSIYENWLTWQDNRDGNWEIYAYNLSADSDRDGIPNYIETPQLANDPALFRITNNIAIQKTPDIYRDTIVWSDFRDGNEDIYAYCFSNDTEWPVTRHPATQWKPAIYGNHIAWSDSRNGNYDVYMCNISTGDISQLSTSDRNDLSPRMYEDKIVWFSYAGSPGGDEFSDIYLFDINDWKLIQVTRDNSLQYSPSVYEGNIVWHDNRNGNWEIYLYSIDTGQEERITYEDEQSFAPHMYGERIVYYYHDRVKGFWSVRMYDMETGNQRDIEVETNGDARPVIYGDRIAWHNKTDGKHDIYVLDFSIIGQPHNVTIDIGCDGDIEFERTGLFDSVEYIDDSAFFYELKSHLPGTGGGSLDIPINISFDNTGRVVIDSLSVTYSLPTSIISSSISNSLFSGVYCYGSKPRFINSTFNGNPTDFTLQSKSDPILLNSTFSESKLFFMDKAANITVQNYLHVKIQTVEGEPVNANLEVLDNGQIVFDKDVGEDGIVQWVVTTDARYNVTGKHENETIVTASLGSYLFDDNPREVDMGSSHWEAFNTQTLVIPLHTGWNLVSIPFITSNQTIDRVLDSIAGSYDLVQIYNASDPLDPWKSYSVHRPTVLNDFTKLDRKLGFWIHATRNCTLEVSGLIEESTPIQLYAGWNLVGYPTMADNMTIATAFSGTGADKVAGFDFNSPYHLTELSPAHLMKPGEGYWVHVPANTIWIVY